MATFANQNWCLLLLRKNSFSGAGIASEICWRLRGRFPLDQEWVCQSGDEGNISETSSNYQRFSLGSNIQGKSVRGHQTEGRQRQSL